MDLKVIYKPFWFSYKLQIKNRYNLLTKEETKGQETYFSYKKNIHANH